MSGGGLWSTQTEQPTAPTDLPSGWEAYFSEEYGRYYFHHGESGATQWVLPRAPGREHVGWVVSLVVATLVAAAFYFRITYLQKHYPEMLKPTRVRKERAGNRISGFDKFKASKPRGKMSQDGKGGRSANS
eukprot:PRCOL_00003165-RA